MKRLQTILLYSLLTSFIALTPRESEANSSELETLATPQPTISQVISQVHPLSEKPFKVPTINPHPERQELRVQRDFGLETLTDDYKKEQTDPKDKFSSKYFLGKGIGFSFYDVGDTSLNKQEIEGFSSYSLIAFRKYDLDLLLRKANIDLPFELIGRLETFAGAVNVDGKTGFELGYIAFLEYDISISKRLDAYFALGNGYIYISPKMEHQTNFNFILQGKIGLEYYLKDRIESDIKKKSNKNKNDKSYPIKSIFVEFGIRDHRSNGKRVFGAYDFGIDEDLHLTNNKALDGPRVTFGFTW